MKIIITHIKKNWSLYVTLVVVYLFLTITDIGCPILYMTGIPCMGCGMTRACTHLLQLDFAGAFYYHPLVFFLPIFVVLYFAFGEKYPKFKKCLIIICAILFIIVYVIRLFDPNDAVVKIDLSNGFIYKVVYSIRERGRIIW